MNWTLILIAVFLIVSVGSVVYVNRLGTKSGSSLPPRGMMEVKPPIGLARCSDDSCPCGFPGTPIAWGEGYLYISPQVVETRRNARSHDAAEFLLSRMQAEAAARGAILVGGEKSLLPTLVCEQGARARHLDLNVARQDAITWWRTSMVPLRPSPTVS